jgi:hypothetical protein
MQKKHHAIHGGYTLQEWAEQVIVLYLVLCHSFSLLLSFLYSEKELKAAMVVFSEVRSQQAWDSIINIVLFFRGMLMLLPTHFSVSMYV